MSQALAALAALAQETRLSVFRMLVEACPEGLAAGDIAERLGLPPATASFHFAQLAQSGLIRARSEGRFVFYAVEFERMGELLDYLTEDCCAGKACLPAVKAVQIATKPVKIAKVKSIEKSARNTRSQ